MARRTLEELATDRDEIFTELAILRKKATGSSGQIRSDAEQKVAQLRRDLEMVNMEINRLQGATAITITGIDA